MGKKEYQHRMMNGQQPTLKVLDEILPSRGSFKEVSLGLVQIPLKQIVGAEDRRQEQCFCGEFHAYPAGGYRVCRQVGVFKHRS